MDADHRRVSPSRCAISSAAHVSAAAVPAGRGSAMMFSRGMLREQLANRLPRARVREDQRVRRIGTIVLEPIHRVVQERLIGDERQQLLGTRRAC